MGRSLRQGKQDGHRLHAAQGDAGTERLGSQTDCHFPDPGDGIQEFKLSELEKTSSLRSPQEAPESGYQPQWIKEWKKRPGRPMGIGTNKNLNFFFRVRTVLDERGNVKSANYGKIYGDFMDLAYFFNPEPNSRNMEFDPTKNLMKNLGPSNHVQQP